MSQPQSKTDDVREAEAQDAQFHRSDLVVVDGNPYQHGYVIEQDNLTVRVRMNGSDKIKSYDAGRLTEAKAWMSKKTSVKNAWK